MKPIIFRARHEPTHKQFKAGNYAKRKVAWRGMTISIENDAGSVRRGYKPDGSMWETRMLFPYGYINRTEGVDGDHVDVFLGPHLDAPMVYIVHQKKVGDWEAYDEDKCLVGFLSEDDARHAFLSCYDDPRFLGPITAMPAADFVEKAKATKEAPAMIKAILFFKSQVKPYTRNGKTVQGYDNHKSPQAGDYPGHDASTRKGGHLSMANRHERQAQVHEEHAGKVKNKKAADEHRAAAADHRAAAASHKEAATKFKDDERDDGSPDDRSVAADTASGRAMKRNIKGYTGHVMPARHEKDTGFDDH